MYLMFYMVPCRIQKTTSTLCSPTPNSILHDADRKESPADTLPWCETLVVVDASKVPELA